MLILDCISCSKDGDNMSSNASTKLYGSDKYSSIRSQSSSVPSNNYEDEFDDFDPRGTASKCSEMMFTVVELLILYN